VKAVILNSGTGSRMGSFTDTNHKSMVEIYKGMPLLKYQINTIANAGIEEFVITTGHLHKQIEDRVKKWFGEKYSFTFVYNHEYKTTNYIYSIYLAREFIKDDILLLHGDLYFDQEVLEKVLEEKNSCLVIDSTLPQPEKDFKARLEEQRVLEVSTSIFDDNCVYCQPLYKLTKQDWIIWLGKIEEFCNNGIRDCYAENALNTVTNKVEIKGLELEGKLCMEVDTLDDLTVLQNKLTLKNN